MCVVCDVRCVTCDVLLFWRQLLSEVAPIRGRDSRRLCQNASFRLFCHVVINTTPPPFFFVT